MSNQDDWVLDPFLGTGTSIVAAIRHDRRGAGAETENKYITISKTRIQEAIAGTLKVRPMNKPKYDPKIAGNKLTKAPWGHYEESNLKQPMLLEERGEYKIENS